MTAISKTLLALEEKFWTGDADFYRRNVDDFCLIAFTKMTGVFSRNDVAETAKDGNRWQSIDLKQKGLIEPVAGVAILTYRVAAIRLNGEPYAAIVSSAYVRRDGGWRMAFHQQTPVDATAAQ